MDQSTSEAFCGQQRRRSAAARRRSRWAGSPFLSTPRPGGNDREERQLLPLLLAGTSTQRGALVLAGCGNAPAWPSSHEHVVQMRLPTVLLSSSALDAMSTPPLERKMRHLVINYSLLAWLTVCALCSCSQTSPLVPRDRRPRRRSSPRILPFSRIISLWSFGVHETPKRTSSLRPHEHRRLLLHIRSRYCVQLNHEHALPPAHRNTLSRALVCSVRLLLMKHDLVSPM